jgi:hypothetical protein
MGSYGTAIASPSSTSMTEFAQHRAHMRGVVKTFFVHGALKSSVSWVVMK